MTNVKRFVKAVNQVQGVSELSDIHQGTYEWFDSFSNRLKKDCVDQESLESWVERELLSELEGISKNLDLDDQDKNERLSLISILIGFLS